MGSPQWGYSAGADYEIDYSCRFNKADIAHLKRTMATPTSTKKFSFSSRTKISGFPRPGRVGPGVRRAETGPRHTPAQCGSHALTNILPEGFW